MNLYFVNLNVIKKVKDSPDLVENIDFAIPAHTPDEALEKSKVYGAGGVLQTKVYPLNKDWK